MSNISEFQDKFEVGIKNDFQKRKVKEFKAYVGKRRDELFSKYPRLQTANRDTFSQALKSKLEEFDKHNADLMNMEKIVDSGELIVEFSGGDWPMFKELFKEWFKGIETHAQELVNGGSIGKKLHEIFVKCGSKSISRGNKTSIGSIITPINNFVLSLIDNQIDIAEKEAKAAQEKVERLKREKNKRLSSLAKGLSLLRAAKSNTSSQSTGQPSPSHQPVETPQNSSLMTSPAGSVASSLSPASNR